MRLNRTQPRPAEVTHFHTAAALGAAADAANAVKDHGGDLKTKRSGTREASISSPGRERIFAPLVFVIFGTSRANITADISKHESSLEHARFLQVNRPPHCGLS